MEKRKFMTPEYFQSALAFIDNHHCSSIIHTVINQIVFDGFILIVLTLKDNETEIHVTLQDQHAQLILNEFDSMQFIYHILLIVICVGTFVVCKSARGGGSRSGEGGARYDVSHQNKSESCDTHECRLREAIFGTIFFIGLITISILIGVCKDRFKSDHRTHEIRIDEKEVLISTDDSITSQKTCDVNMFQSGVWSSQHFQCKTWHGPHPFPLLFNSQTMKIKGTGSDDIGVFTIKGFYSTKTNRIVLKKEYKSNTGNTKQNSGHSVKMKLMWNEENNQFEGNWHINTTKYRGYGKFNLQFHEKSLAIESDSNGAFNVNTCYTKSLNNYVTHEDYLYLLSIINPQLKQLMIYKYLYWISIRLIGLVCEFGYALISIFGLVDLIFFQRTTFQTTNDLIWNIEFYSDSKSILVVECPSLCLQNVMNPIATTPSIPQLSTNKFQTETVNHIHSSSERVQYNPQLDTIITLEPDK
ncbi:unnamed protein product [Adineta steineri]|uniref:Uncharacterized protein n=1 Tax=Adineta steineri TaxID=433720 RepID=A0A819WHI1_9BILA|nr:unnamed protein product [Adineta steineri]